MSMYFDGTTSLSIADDAALSIPNADWTVGFWIKQDAPRVQFDHVFSWNPVNSAQSFGAFINTSDALIVRVRGASGFESLDYTGGLGSEWNAVLLYRTGNTLVMRVNNVVEDSLTIAAPSSLAINAANPWYLGKETNDSDNQFKGRLAEFFKIDRVFTNDEMQQFADGKRPDLIDSDLDWYLPGDTDRVEQIEGITVTNDGSTIDEWHPAITNVDPQTRPVLNSNNLGAVTQIGDRIVNGNGGRLFLAGDSISTDITTNRFPNGIFAKWTPRNFAGVFINDGTLGSTQPGLVSIDYTVTNTSYSSYDPDEAGLFSPALNPLYPNHRLEREATGAVTDPGNGYEDSYIEDTMKPGESEAWAVGDWLTNKDLTVNKIYLQFENASNDTWRLNSFWRDESLVYHVTQEATFNPYNASSQPSVQSVSFDFTSLESGWRLFGSRLKGPSAGLSSGDGFCSLYTHIYQTDNPDGFHFGTMCVPGYDAREWKDAIDESVLEDLFVETKLNTFAIMFGANDSGQSRTKLEYKSDIMTLVKILRRVHQAAQVRDSTIKDLRFLLTGMYHIDGDSGDLMGDYSEALYEITLDSNFSSDCGFLNLYNLFDGTSRAAGLVSDGTHPTESGAEEFMETFWRELESSVSTITGVGRLNDIVNIPSIGAL